MNAYHLFLIQRAWLGNISFICFHSPSISESIHQELFSQTKVSENVVSHDFSFNYICSQSLSSLQRYRFLSHYTEFQIMYPESEMSTRNGFIVMQERPGSLTQTNFCQKFFSTRRTNNLAHLKFFILT